MSYFPPPRKYVWLQMPAAAANDPDSGIPDATEEIYQNTKRRVYSSLVGCRRCRVYGRIFNAGAAGILGAAQFSVDDGTTWYYLDGSADGVLTTQEPQISIEPVDTGQTSAWVDLPDSAKVEDVLFRFVQANGASVDAGITHLMLEFI